MDFESISIQYLFIPVAPRCHRKISQDEEPCTENPSRGLAAQRTTRQKIQQNAKATGRREEAQTGRINSLHGGRHQKNGYQGVLQRRLHHDGARVRRLPGPLRRPCHLGLPTNRRRNLRHLDLLQSHQHKPVQTRSVPPDDAVPRDGSEEGRRQRLRPHSQEQEGNTDGQRPRLLPQRPGLQVLPRDFLQRVRQAVPALVRPGGALRRGAGRRGVRAPGLRPPDQPGREGRRGAAADLPGPGPVLQDL